MHDFVVSPKVNKHQNKTNFYLYYFAHKICQLLLVIYFIIGGGQVVFAGPPNPAILYSERPSILSLPAEQLPANFWRSVLASQIHKHWPELIRGHFEVLICLMQMYRDYDLYFLARDAELLYDTARLLTATDRRSFPQILQDEFSPRVRHMAPFTPLSIGTVVSRETLDRDARERGYWSQDPDPAYRPQRIHMLNISRENINDANVMAYLAQEGLSEQSLRSGTKKALIIDTGYRGSIPLDIINRFSPLARRNIKTYFMTSENLNQIPDANAFFPISQC